MAEAVARLANVCLALGYFLARFKEVQIVVLCKPGKPSYNNLGTWWPIVLLNIIGKLIESLITKRLSQATEEYKLLPDTQIGARPDRLTKIVLKLFIA